ncbi:hypothetical protein Tco_0703707 [Tanacetum coccineum]|uniref:BESS domain-containing protein n=1 Tax=Tanacetum coccineum TaxID=301880 RepID=A0ABQ4Y0G7_9ASTR
MLRSLLAERTRHQRQYKRRVNKRQMQTQESEIDTGKALDVDLVDSKPETLGQTQQFKDDNSKDNSILSNLKSLMKVQSFNPKMEELKVLVAKRLFKLAPQFNQNSQAAETVTTSNELDLLFGPLFDEYFNGENQVVLKSSAVTTTDASNKRQQQPDSTSSTSTLATSVTADGNFDL